MDSSVAYQTRPAKPPRRWATAGLVAFALGGGIAIFVFGTPYFEVAATNDSPIYNAIVVATFWGLARVLRDRPGMVSFAACSQALFVAAAAMLVMVVGPFNWLLSGDDDTIQFAVRDKLAQFLAVVPVILLLTMAARKPGSWLYLQMGRPKRWLTFGAGSFVAIAFVVFTIALVSGAAASELLAATPWLLAFVALNALMEELWFRGVFLRTYTAHMTGSLAIVVTALIFGAAHIGATYIESLGAHLLFAGLVVALGVTLAWAIRWANALWGAVLFHAGLDLVVILELID